MCTLIVLDRVVPGIPLVVASNRDEYFDRPAAPPTVVGSEGGAPAFVAPQDLQAGGTWMGLNSKGLFVGLTNRACEAPDPARRSRGLLVLDGLAASDAGEVAAKLTPSHALAHNPFHLLCADGTRACLAVRSDDGFEQHELEPGRHVVCNRDAADPSTSKTRDIQAAVDRLDVDAPFEQVFDGLAEILRGHPDASNPFANPCVHTERYGTRSSSVIALGRKRWRYWHSEGPPCEAKYRNHTRSVDAMLAAVPAHERNEASK